MLFNRNPRNTQLDALGWLSHARRLEDLECIYLLSCDPDAPAVIRRISEIVYRDCIVPTTFNDVAEIAMKAADPYPRLTPLAEWVQCRFLCGIDENAPLDPNTIPNPSGDGAWLEFQYKFLGYVYNSAKPAQADYDHYCATQFKIKPTLRDSIQTISKVSGDGQDFARLMSSLILGHEYVRALVVEVSRSREDELLGAPCR